MSDFTTYLIQKIIFSPLSKKIPEKLSGLSVKGGVGVPPISAKGFLEKWFSVKGVGGGGDPLNGQNPLKRFWQVPFFQHISIYTDQTLMHQSPEFPNVDINIAIIINFYLLLQFFWFLGNISLFSMTTIFIRNICCHNWFLNKLLGGRGRYKRNIMSYLVIFTSFCIFWTDFLAK